MKEQVQNAIKRLRAICADIGKIPNPQHGPGPDPTEDNLDNASDSIRKAIAELEEIIDRI